MGVATVCGGQQLMTGLTDQAVNFFHKMEL
jgi:hypothetical protein